MKINEVAHFGYNKEVHRKESDIKKRNLNDKTDSLEISKDARALHANTALLIKAKGLLQETDDVRYDKIEEARERIREGFYYLDDVSKVIVKNIMENLGIE